MPKVDKQDQWCPCWKAEWVLRSMNINFMVGKVAIKDVNWRATEQNCGRINGQAVNKERVEDYRDAMRQGMTFPMVVMVKTSTGYVVVAGVHRSLAAKECDDRQVVSCYIAEIELTHEWRMVATMTNRMEGDGLSREDVVPSAIQLVTVHNLKPQDVAEKLRIGVSTIHRHLKNLKMREQAALAGATKIGKISDTVLSTLGKLSGNSNVLAAAVECAVEHKMPLQEVRDLATNVLERKTEAEQLKAVADESARRKIEVQTPSVIKLHNRTVFLRAFHTCCSMSSGKKTFSQMQLGKTEDEINNLEADWKEFSKTLNGMFAQWKQSRKANDAAGSKGHGSSAV